MDLLVEPGESLNGEITVPGDKSISHRAVMCASIASGSSKLKGFLESDDCLSTLDAFKELGVKVSKEEDSISIQGLGLKGFTPPSKPLYLGNSGTSMRLISGILAGQDFESILTGDESLLKRPMARITEPLNNHGFNLVTELEGRPPIRIIPSGDFKKIDYQLPIASAQVKSCLMFAALFSSEKSIIKETLVTRDHTERMFKEFGVDLNVNKTNGSSLISLKSSKGLKASDINIPGDFSSASFFILAALITPHSHICIKEVGVNESRVGFLQALKQMGADIKIDNFQDGNEPKADIEVKYSELKSINLDPRLIPNMIDELPSFFIAAAVAEGITIIKGAKELRFKESDRLASMANSLNQFGVKYSISDDDIEIEGIKKNKLFKKAEIDSFGDHRIAMASVVASLRSEGACKILNCSNISTSFPDFLRVSNSIGIRVNTA